MKPRWWVLLFSCFLLLGTQAAISRAVDAYDLWDIGAAFMTNLSMHELGHQIIADKVGAENHQIRFFTRNDGYFYLGLSTYDSIPAESRLAYAAGGERMSVFTFEYGLQSYRDRPTTFNRALMFFSTVDFLSYTLLANYVHPDNDMYDPNLIRKETGCSKEMLLGIAATKSLINTYRVLHPDSKIRPMIETSKESVIFLIGFQF